VPDGARELRLVVNAPDYDKALRFYRDALGLGEEATFVDDNGGRATLLGSGIGRRPGISGPAGAGGAERRCDPRRPDRPACGDRQAARTRGGSGRPDGPRRRTGRGRLGRARPRPGSGRRSGHPRPSRAPGSWRLADLNRGNTARVATPAEGALPASRSGERSARQHRRYPAQCSGCEPVLGGT